MPAGPGNYTELRNTLDAVLEAQWPEAHANGIHISFANLLKKAEADQLPLILCSISLAPDPPHWEDTGPVVLHYVRMQAADDVTTYFELIAKGQLIQTALLNLDFADSFIQGRPAIDASRNTALNQYFEESGQPFWSVRVAFTVVTGEVTP